MRTRTSVLLLVAALFGASCGDDDASPATSEAPTTTAAPTTTEAPSVSIETTEETEPSREPTPEEIRSASLLFGWQVTFTKTATVVPAPTGEIPNGTQYMIELTVEGVCDDDGKCIQQSTPHVDNWGWTIMDETQPYEWATDGLVWTSTMYGYFLSSKSPDATCVYEWIEEWEIEITDAVQDGETWLATAFSGTMLRTEQLDPSRSRGECFPYAGVDKWAAESERVMAPVP